MIAYVKGILTYRDLSHAIIECNGIGYAVIISLNTYGKLPVIGEEAMLHTYFLVKEDSQTLYGFAQKQEKELFSKLIKVSGIGGNTAMTILSSLTPVEFRQALANEDINLFKKIKGIGAKTAGRIILDLKGKLATESDEPAELGSMTAIRQEALSALTSLGFARSSMETKVDQVIKSHGSTISVEELIKAALKG